MTQPTTNNAFFLKLGVLVLAIAAYLFLPGIEDFITTGTGFLKHRDFFGLRHFILSHGVWAPVTSIALMAIQSLVPFVPGLAITITNAWVFGWQYGALYSWIGALLGAVLDFGLARWYGRPFVERMIHSRYFTAVDTYLRKHGILAVLITRIIPILPFKVISYGAGLTAIPVREFIVATGIGQAPAIILYSILGQNLMRSFRATFMITACLVLVGLIIYYYRDWIENFFSKKIE